MMMWDEQRTVVCNRIARHGSTMKIVIKTKDDPFFLARWVEHHSAIVGLENLIIFDNCSNDDRVLALYSDIESRATVVSFSGYADRIHRYEQFTELYDALRASTEFYSFIDTDEALVWARPDGTYLADQRILSELRSLPSPKVVPGVWLENVRGYNDRFQMNLEVGHLQIGLRAGKPVFSATTEVKGMLNHNFQVESSLMPDDIRTNLLVLHRKWLSSSQRIASNLLKLRAYKWLKQDESIYRVLETDPDHEPPGNTRNFIREIQTLYREPQVETSENDPLSRNHVILSDGKLTFGSDRQSETFVAFLTQPDHYRSFIKP